MNIVPIGQDGFSVREGEHFPEEVVYLKRAEGWDEAKIDRVQQVVDKINQLRGWVKA